MSNTSFKTKIKIQLSRVIVSKEAHLFIVVQMKQPNEEKSTKFRTEISALTNRPQFQKNQFIFAIEDFGYAFKFGLMMAQSQLNEDAAHAVMLGYCSFPFTKSRLLEQSSFIYETSLVFMDRGKEVGKFSVRISFVDKEHQLNDDGVIFDPLISRVLYNQQCRDQTKLQTNVRILEQKLANLYHVLCESKKQQNFFQKLYSDLQIDEKQLKTEIENLQKINSKIEHKLNSLESRQNLAIEIEMLSQSEEGKKVLISRLQYFQDRIYREVEDNEKLVIEYKKIKPEIQANLQKAENHAQKLQGKHLQEFELENNLKILESYEDVRYQFYVNEETIKSLSKMSQKSQFTAQQAKLILSQVSYQIKLAEVGGVSKQRNAKQNRLLKEIEKEMRGNEKKERELTEQEKMVYKIKLFALQAQIEETRKKLSQISGTNKKEYAKKKVKISSEPDD